jgi:hypothetical protein
MLKIGLRSEVSRLSEFQKVPEENVIRNASNDLLVQVLAEHRNIQQGFKKDFDESLTIRAQTLLKLLDAREKDLSFLSLAKSLFLRWYNQYEKLPQGEYYTLKSLLI